MIFLDIDGLKSVNDNQGHEVGDAFIAEIADVLKRAVPKDCLIMRYGGDEFVVFGSCENGDRMRAIVSRIMPTALIIFYVTFLTAYHAQSSRRAQAEMQSTMLEAGLKQSQIEVDALRRAEVQTAVYQHDMRHHLNAIDGFLAAGKPQQAEEYIRKVRSDIERITPKRYCDNELVNLLCSSFTGKAQRMGVRLEVDAKLPRELSVSDTELCAVLSNALENALRAVSDQPEADRWVTLYCGVRLGKLLVEIQNPCAEGLVMRDGLPVSERAGHGYGCRSIQTIAERRGGLCEFRARGGIFSMQLVLPIKAAAKTQD